jgi:prepilin-type N-terminal cleavage/methylation domain-containing protein
MKTRELSPGRKPLVHLTGARNGFSLAELMVVLVIIAILLAITVPVIKNGQSQRELANSVAYMSTNFQWAMSEARKSGQTVYMGFKWRYDRNQIEAPLNYNVNSDSPLDGGPPDNPGVARVATGYYFVKEQPRTWSHPDPTLPVPAGQPGGGAPYTYLDFLNEFNAGNAPREPLYPIDVAATNESLMPTQGSMVNATSTPEFFYPMDLNSSNTYASNFLGYAYQTGALNFPTDATLQDNKLFCTANLAEIQSYDWNGNGKYDPGLDHPMLIEQMVDYILLREVDFPESVYVYNPYQDKFVVSYSSVQGPGSEVYGDFQSLQYLYAINPDGTVEVSQWAYGPEPFPDGTAATLVHGHVERRPSAPLVYYFFFATEEVVDPENGWRIQSNRRAQASSSARLLTIWPLNGRYFTIDYTPNDVSRYIEDDSPKLDVDDAASGFGRYTPVTAYRRNFLVPAP